MFYICAVLWPWSAVRSPQSAVRSPQSAVGGLSFILPDLKRFTLRRVMLQGYNKSIFISEKTFSLILWKRVGHDTGRLWLPVGVTFPLETAWRRHATRIKHSFTARRPPSCLQSRNFRFYSPLLSQVSLVGWQLIGKSKMDFTSINSVSRSFFTHEIALPRLNF